MSLDPHEIALVRASYAMIRPETRDYSDLFYLRLLQRHPFTRVLFPDDMAHQIEVFRTTIDALVEGIDAPDALHPELAALAQRHVGYGVEPEHYAIVGEVLIQAFAELLEDRFTPPMRRAWERLYAEVATTMIDVAYRD